MDELTDLRTAAYMLLDAAQDARDYLDIVNTQAAESRSRRLTKTLEALHAELAQGGQKPVDVGLLEYKGNSVEFIYQKMQAYRSSIDDAWRVLRAKGLHPDGKTSFVEIIDKNTAPPRREWQGLTDEEEEQCRKEATVKYNRHKHSIRGQTISPADDWEWHFVRTIEEKLKEKNYGK